MADAPEEPTDDTPVSDGDADDAVEAGDDSGASAPRSSTPQLGLQGLLSRDSDQASRPGFRNPGNARSKVQKKKKGKKGRR